MTTDAAKPRINRGLSLISLGIVLAIVLISAPIGLEKYSNYVEEQTWRVTATHLSTVSQGARRYVNDNYATLLTQVAGGGNVTVTGETLRDKGYLPTGFSLTNTHAQTYLLAVIGNPAQADKLVAFVLTVEGQEITFKGQRVIAQTITGLGGYIFPANIANGAGGGWQVNLASFGLSGQTGHLVAYLTSDVLASGSEENDRLYRFQVGGRPDLNKMHTAIDMGVNDLNNANTVDANTGNFRQTVTAQNLASRDGVSAAGGMSAGGGITAGGDIRSNSGWIITQHGKGWLNADHGGGFYMEDNDWVRSVNNKGIYTAGQIRGGSLRADGRLSTGEFLQIDAVATAGAGCGPNGLIGRDDRGAVMSCQNGIWTLGGALQQRECRQIGNFSGRDFTHHVCPVGWYSAGLQFVGHQNNESAYAITCCH